MKDTRGRTTFLLYHKGAYDATTRTFRETLFAVATDELGLCNDTTFHCFHEFRNRCLSVQFDRRIKREERKKIPVRAARRTRAPVSGLAVARRSLR